MDGDWTPGGPEDSERDELVELLAQAQSDLSARTRERETVSFAAADLKRECARLVEDRAAIVEALRNTGGLAEQDGSDLAAVLSGIEALWQRADLAARMGRHAAPAPLDCSLACDPDDVEQITCEVCGCSDREDAPEWTHEDTPEDGRLHFCPECSAMPDGTLAAPEPAPRGVRLECPSGHVYHTPGPLPTHCPECDEPWVAIGPTETIAAPEPAAPAPAPCAACPPACPVRAAAEAACNAAAMQRDACDEDDTVLRARFDGVRCAFAAALAQPAPEHATDTDLGVALILAERLRQRRAEGWTPAHDDGHVYGELARAAAALAVDGTDAMVEDPDGDFWGLVARHGYRAGRTDAARRLTIAGALLAAEIGRVLRRDVQPAPERATGGSDATDV